jgi:hypothetical protein
MLSLLLRTCSVPYMSFNKSSRRYMLVPAQVELAHSSVQLSRSIIAVACWLPDGWQLYAVAAASCTANVKCIYVHAHISPVLTVCFTCSRNDKSIS